MRSKELDGQLNLFGSEPYQPKKAGSVEKHPVELDMEAEEFLSVGRRKKKEEVLPETDDKKTPDMEKEKTPDVEEKKIPDVEKKKTPGGGRKNKAASGYSIVMQRSFIGDDGALATTAYLDYNLVYVEGTDRKASIFHFRDSKKAVDRYLSEIEGFEKASGLKRTETNPPLKEAAVQEDEGI